MMITHRILAVCSASLMAMSAARAIDTATGFPEPDPSASTGTQLSGLGSTGPYGSYDASNVGFAAWEKWSSGVFSGFVSQYTGASGVLTATLSQNNSGIGLSTSGSNPGLLTVGETDYYGRLTAGSGSTYDFSLTGSSSIAISSITLQIKHSRFLDENFEAQIPFTASLNGGATISPVMGTALSNFSDALTMSTTTNVYTFTWTGLNIAANEAFNISFSSIEDTLGFGFSVDSIALSVEGLTAVPEPGTYGMAIAIGLGAILLSKRRKASRRSAAASI